jgi:hypothetical protein
MWTIAPWQWHPNDACQIFVVKDAWPKFLEPPCPMATKD